MGYRASVLKQHREYGSNIFSNWNDFQTYWSELRDRYEGRDDLTDGMYENEAEDFYEIPKEMVKLEIERLKKLPEDSIEESLGEEVKYVISGLEAALEEAPEQDDYIALEWF
jgi:hypothetical protein